MFPRPIEHASPAVRIGYQVVLPIALLIWLLPLLAIFMTSIRPGGDINAGNVFGWPSNWQMIENYAAVFQQSKAMTYLWNSVKITVPTVIIAVSLSCLTGYALSAYRFRWALPLFFVFVAGNFVPFQILMVPVRDFSVQTGLYDTITGLVLFHAAFQTGFCTLFMRNFMKALPFELIESARIEGVSELKIFWHIVLPLVRPGQIPEWTVREPMAPGFSSLAARGLTSGADVLCHAKAFYCWPDPWSIQGLRDAESALPGGTVGGRAQYHASTTLVPS